VTQWLRSLRLRGFGVLGIGKGTVVRGTGLLGDHDLLLNMM
jgi:hypothetical protein